MTMYPILEYKTITYYFNILTSLLLSLLVVLWLQANLLLKLLSQGTTVFGTCVSGVQGVVHVFPAALASLTSVVYCTSFSLSSVHTTSASKHCF